MSVALGLVGFGEAGRAIAAGLREEGVSVSVYDVRHEVPELRAAAEGLGVHWVASPAELAGRCAAIVALTSAKVAVLGAREMAPHLSSSHVYADWNSASPALMSETAEVITATGARFADGAVMAVVPPHRHKVPVLLSGDGAEAFAAVAAKAGMVVEVLGDVPGQASAVKMFRSVLVKGLEALVLECVMGAEAYGASDRVLASMAGSLPFDDWQALASYLMTRTALHGDRRAEELRQATTTLEAVGVPPLLSPAAAQRLQEFADLKLGPRLGEPPYTYTQIMQAMRLGESDR